jgi:hypothetical protein
MSNIGNLFVVIFLCFVCLCFGGYLGVLVSVMSVTDSDPVSDTDSTIQENQEYTVQRIRVVEGHVFDVSLENGKRYLIALHRVPSTPPEAKDQVVRCLNDYREREKPLICVPIFWDTNQQRYVGDIYLDGTRSMSLTDWLTARSLIYSR